MNAFNTINLAGAAVLTSTAFAQELGIPKTKWIYALGAAGTQDSGDCTETPNIIIRPMAIANNALIRSLGETELPLKPIHRALHRCSFRVVQPDEGGNRSL